MAKKNSSENPQEILNAIHSAGKSPVTEETFEIRLDNLVKYKLKPANLANSKYRLALWLEQQGIHPVEIDRRVRKAHQESQIRADSRAYLLSQLVIVSDELMESFKSLTSRKASDKYKALAEATGNSVDGNLHEFEKVKVKSKSIHSLSE